ncbi:MAG: metallophosphoesterase, partial [Syntrophus sp. (in: bacteria)]
MTSIKIRCAITAFLLDIFSIVFAIICGVIPVHADQSQRFVWVGDSQGATNGVPITTDVLTPIVDSILALSPAPKVVIFGGDMAHRANITNLNSFKALFTDRLDAAGIPSASGVGNHDLYSQSPIALTSEALTRQQEFQARFNSSWTQNGPAGFTNLAFSFHFGNSLFIIADSYYATANGPEPVYGINQTQQTWIQGLLKNNTASHSFVFTHIPAFNPWNPSADANMANTWQTITTSGNATNTNASMLFTGHLHLYYRTQRDGVYQVTAGSAGAERNCQDNDGNLHACGPIEPGDVYPTPIPFNYAVVTINGREVAV